MDYSNKNKIKELRNAIKAFKKNGDVDMVIRIKAIIAYLTNKPVEKIADYYDVSIRTVRRWIKDYERNGIDGLIIKARTGRPPKLNQDELDKLKMMITKEQGRVWVARHIYQLIVTLFSSVYSVKYIPELLRKIELSYHKAVHYLVKRNEEKRSTWIQERLPKIYEDHIKEGWRIFFQDEVGFQTEGTLAYSWGPIGEDIVVKNYGRHGRVNLMGVYEVGSGEFFYRTTFLRGNALRFKRFLCCLKRKFRSDKILIIADNASFHKAKWFTKWWQGLNWLRIEFLPAYSPDFNPIERLWKWIKKEYVHNQCWLSKEKLREYLEEKLSGMIENKEQYIGTMKKELLRLKAAFDNFKISFIWNEHLPKSTHSFIQQEKHTIFLDKLTCFKKNMLNTTAGEFRNSI
jgi:transposase